MHAATPSAAAPAGAAAHVPSAHQTYSQQPPLPYNTPTDFRRPLTSINSVTPANPPHGSALRSKKRSACDAGMVLPLPHLQTHSYPNTPTRHFGTGPEASLAYVLSRQGQAAQHGQEEEPMRSTKRLAVEGGNGAEAQQGSHPRPMSLWGVGPTESTAARCVA